MQVGVSTWYPNDLTGGLDADVAAFLARLTTPPTTERAALYNTFIVDLKAAGVWDKLDVLYLMAAADSQAARLNLKSSSFTLNTLNSPTFTADRGYNGDGVASYLNTTLNPNVGGPYQFSLNSATVGIWINQTSGGTDAYDFGNVDGGNNLKASLRTHRLNNTCVAILNSASSAAPASTSPLGLTTVTRTDGTEFKVLRDSGILAQPAIASDVVGNIMYFGARATTTAAGGYSTRRYPAFFMGGGLTNVEVGALYTALSTYLTAVGGN